MPLQDTTGNRRFAVIYLQRVRLDDLKAVLPIDRLWGAAMWLWKVMGLTPALDVDAQETVNQVNADATDEHVWTDILRNRLEFGHDFCCTAQEILTNILGIYPDAQTQKHKQDLANIFRLPYFQTRGVTNKVMRQNDKVLRVWRGCRIKS